VNSEQPYYSTVSAQQPDAIEMKDNDAYVKPPPARREIIVEENPAYTITVQNFTRNAPWQLFIINFRSYSYVA